MEKELTRLLEELAVQLGTTTEYLWGILIKQAPLSGIFNICLLVFSLISVITLLFTLKNWLKRDENGHDKFDKSRISEMVGIIFYLVGLISLGLTISGFINLPGAITAIYNPEYWALQDILRSLK